VTRSRRELILVAVATLVAAACAAAPSQNTSAPLKTASPAPTTAIQPTSAAASTMATPAASQSPAVASSAPTSPPPLIPDGLYVTPALNVADAVATINADTKLSTADKADLIENGFEFRPQNETFVVTLRFQAGKLDQGIAIDGGGIQIGDHLTYAFSGTDTLVAQELAGGINTFAVASSGSNFTLKIVSVPTGSDADSVAAQILYESAPFGLRP
jgi:hypothetical protein